MERLSVQREVNGDARLAVRALVDAACAFAAGASLTKDQAARLAIIVEELAVNAFDHGAASCVELSLQLDGKAVRLAIDDDGGAFDLRGHHPADRPDPVSGGGTGLALVQSWCRIEHYARLGGRNRLTLILPVAG